MDVIVSIPVKGASEGEQNTQLCKVHLSRSHLMRAVHFDPHHQSNSAIPQPTSASGKVEEEEAHLVEELAALETLGDFGKYCCYLALRSDARKEKKKKNSKRATEQGGGGEPVDSEEELEQEDLQLREDAVALAETLCLMLPGGVEGGGSSGGSPSFGGPQQPAVILRGGSSYALAADNEHHHKSSAVGAGSDNDAPEMEGTTTTAAETTTVVAAAASSGGGGNRCMFASNVLPPEIQNQQLWRHVLLAASVSGVITIIYPHFSLTPWRKVLNPIADLVVLFNTWNAEMEVSKKTGRTGNLSGTHLLGPAIASTVASPLNFVAGGSQQATFSSPMSPYGGTGGKPHQQADNCGGGASQLELALNLLETGSTGRLTGGGLPSALLPPPEVQVSKAQVDEANKILFFFEGRAKEGAPGVPLTTNSTTSGGGGGAATGPAEPQLQIQDSELLNVINPYTSAAHNASHSHRTASSALRVSISPDLLCAICGRIPHTGSLRFMVCCGAFGCKKCLAVPEAGAAAAVGGGGEISGGGGAASSSAASVIKFRCVGCDETMLASPISTAPTATISESLDTTRKSSSSITTNSSTKGATTAGVEGDRDAWVPEYMRRAPVQAAKVAVAVKTFLLAHCKDKEIGILGAALTHGGGVGGSGLLGSGGLARPTLAPPPGFNAQPPPGFTRAHPGSPMMGMGAARSPIGGLLGSPHASKLGGGAAPVGFRMLPKSTTTAAVGAAGSTTTPGSLTSTASPTPSTLLAGAKGDASLRPLSADEPAATKRRIE